jgi:hypothetical protein
MLSELLLIFTIAGAFSPMELVKLHVAGRVSDVVAADLDGNQQKDVLVVWQKGYPPKSKSIVSVFLTKDFKVTNKPAQIHTLPSEAVAYDVSDINLDGHADFLYLAANGVWALYGQAGGLSSTPRQLLEAMTIGALASEDKIPRMQLVVDLGNQRKVLLVPTVPIGPFALYEKDGGKWTLGQVLRVPLRARVLTAAEDFRAARDFGALFYFDYPRWQAIDQNGDKKLDLMFFRRDRVAVFRMQADGKFKSTPDFYRNFKMLNAEENIKKGINIRGVAGDISGDGRADIMFNKTVGGIRNMKTELRIYLADKNADYPGWPNFRKKRKGHGSSAQLIDVNGDKKADLVWPHVEVGITTMIQMMMSEKLELDFEVYFSQGGRLRNKPNLIIESAFGINLKSNQELLGLYPKFDLDFNKDGILDLLVGDPGEGGDKFPDQIKIRLAQKPGKYQEDPAWTLDLPGTRFVLPFQISAESAPGLLIYFSLVKKHRGDVWVLHNRQ